MSDIEKTTPSREYFEQIREAEQARDSRATQRYYALRSSWASDVDPATGLYKRDLPFVEVEKTEPPQTGEQV